MLLVAFVVGQLWGPVLFVIHSQCYYLYFCFVCCCLLSPFETVILLKTNTQLYENLSFFCSPFVPQRKMPYVLYLRLMGNLQGKSVPGSTILPVLKFQSKIDLP